MALLTYPSKKWRAFLDPYATQNLVLEVREIFRVIKGFEKRWNVRWNENVRALVALAASMGWELDRMDVTIYFLYAKLDEDTFVDIPKGVVPVEVGNRVWKPRTL